MKKTNLTIAILIGWITVGFSQSFLWEAKLPKVNQDGYYSILLSPQITSRLNDVHSDLRLLDELGNELPYLFQEDNSFFTHHFFKEYEIIENSSIKNCCTKLTIRNKNKNNINNIGLIIRNADVTKKATLSGSDDLKSWYSIKNNYRLESIYNSERTNVIKMLSFPKSNYEYYQIEISDSSSRPLNILKAGYYEDYINQGKFIRLPTPLISQKDSSDKKSYIKISYPYEHLADKISINIGGPEFYYREAGLYRLVESKKANYFEEISTFNINSKTISEHYIESTKFKDLYLIIDNKDNPPLKIKNVVLYQIAQYVTANLKEDNTYYLKFGNKELPFPQYDLQYFSDSLSQDLPVLEIQEPIAKAEVKEATFGNSIFVNKLWLWTALGVIISLLAFMTYIMLGELKN